MSVLCGNTLALLLILYSSLATPSSRSPSTTTLEHPESLRRVILQDRRCSFPRKTFTRHPVRCDLPTGNPLSRPTQLAFWILVLYLHDSAIVLRYSLETNPSLDQAMLMWVFAGSAFKLPIYGSCRTRCDRYSVTFPWVTMFYPNIGRCGCSSTDTPSGRGVACIVVSWFYPSSTPESIRNCDVALLRVPDPYEVIVSIRWSCCTLQHCPKDLLTACLQ